MCGECCSGSMKIFLNREDLIRMAHFLNYKSTKSLFENGYVVIDRERGGAPLPRINFKTRPFSFCPFLENREENGKWLGYCKMHPNIKPLVCRMAPVSRTIDLVTSEESFSFHKPYPDCPGCKSRKKIYIDEWIQPYRKELDKETDFFMQLSSCLPITLNDDEVTYRFYSISVPYNESN